MRKPPGADIPVIMVTTVQDPDLGYALCASDFLTKPVDPRRLSAVLARYVEKGTKGTVLVVDDDLTTRDLLRRILEREGCRVLEAESGLIALELLEENDRPDLVLLDLMMPDMDGLGFLVAIQENSAWDLDPGGGLHWQGHFPCGAKIAERASRAGLLQARVRSR